MGRHIVDDQKKLKEEIQSIYDLLLERDEAAASSPFDERATKNIETNKAFRQYIVIPIITTVILLSVIIYFYQLDLSVSVSNISKYTLMVGYIGLIILLFTQIFKDNNEFSDFFKNPLTAVFNGLTYTVDDDTKCVIGLKKYSVEALFFVKDRMEMQYSTIQHRFSNMVGGLTKIGILPGLLALFIGISNLPVQKFAYSFAIIFLVFYFLSFWVQHSLPRINFYIRLIETELNLRAEKEN